MRGFSGFGEGASPLKEADNKLIEQSADIRKKAEEIEDEFIKNFKIPNFLFQLGSRKKKKKFNVTAGPLVPQKEQMNLQIKK